MALGAAYAYGELLVEVARVSSISMCAYLGGESMTRSYGIQHTTTAVLLRAGLPPPTPTPA